MPAKSLSDLSDKMREIDIAMLMTRTDGGAIAGRPMSNNGDVEYDGDSFYFTMQDARMVADIEADPTVSLAFQGEDMFMVAVQGKGAIVRDKAAFEQHWNPDLDDWFKDGVDTEGLVMIKVSAERVHYWDGEENGEVKL